MTWQYHVMSGASREKSVPYSMHDGTLFTFTLSPCLWGTVALKACTLEIGWHEPAAHGAQCRNVCPERPAKVYFDRRPRVATRQDEQLVLQVEDSIELPEGNGGSSGSSEARVQGEHKFNADQRQ